MTQKDSQIEHSRHQRRSHIMADCCVFFDVFFLLLQQCYVSCNPLFAFYNVLLCAVCTEITLFLSTGNSYWIVRGQKIQQIVLIERKKYDKLIKLSNLLIATSSS